MLTPQCHGLKDQVPHAEKPECTVPSDVGLQGILGRNGRSGQEGKSSEGLGPGLRIGVLTAWLIAGLVMEKSTSRSGVSPGCILEDFSGVHRRDLPVISRLSLEIWVVTAFPDLLPEHIVGPGPLRNGASQGFP